MIGRKGDKEKKSEEWNNGIEGVVKKHIVYSGEKLNLTLIYLIL